MPSLDCNIYFTSELFDYTSELPVQLNAGNRFYGQDVASYIAERLNEAGHACACLEEDWGWLVVGTIGQVKFEAAVYNLNEHGLGGLRGAPSWRLWFQAYASKRTWNLFARRKSIPVPTELVQTVLSALKAAGAAIEPASAQPG